MKKLIRNTHTFLFYTLLFIMLLIFSGCDKDAPELSDRDALIEALTGTWVVDETSYIQINGQDITDLLLGFEIAITSDLTYTTNSDELTLEEFPWPTSGSFEISDDLRQFTRNDGLVITLTLSDDELSLDMEFEADENTDSGRTEGVKGGWKCGLSKK